MVQLTEEDLLYLDKLQAKGIIFYGHDQLTDKNSYYFEYIKTEKFMNHLFDILKDNKKREFLDSGVKDNILKIISYIIDNIKTDPNLDSSHHELLSECKRFIFTTKGAEAGVSDYYKEAYLKRTSDINWPFLMKIPKAFSNVHNTKNRELLHKSMAYEHQTLIDLLYADLETFLTEYILYYIFKRDFIDTINVTIMDNPQLFDYPGFKEKAMFVLLLNIKTANGTAPYIIVHDLQSIPYELLDRSARTLNRIKKMK